MPSKLETYSRLVDEYTERFNEGPPDFHFSDDDEGIKLMRRAIERGRPIESDEIAMPRPGEDF